MLKIGLIFILFGIVASQFSTVESTGAELVSAIIAGASLAGTTIDQIANKANCNRYCAIEIRNYHYAFDLKNPKYYIRAGTNQEPPPPVIRGGYKEACLFRKIYDTATGSVGVLSYEIHKVERDRDKKVLSSRNTGNKLFLLWSIPYDYNFYSNWQAVGITQNKEPNQNTYEEMYYRSSPWFTRKSAAGTAIRHRTKINNIPIEVISTMSEVGGAKWIIDFS